MSQGCRSSNDDNLAYFEMTRLPWRRSGNRAAFLHVSHGGAAPVRMRVVRGTQDSEPVDRLVWQAARTFTVSPAAHL